LHPYRKRINAETHSCKESWSGIFAASNAISARLLIVFRRRIEGELKQSWENVRAGIDFSILLRVSFKRGCLQQPFPGVSLTMAHCDSSQSC